MRDAPRVPPPTQRLAFRTWTEADLDLARSLWGDPEVTRFLGGPFSEEQVRERLEEEISTQTTDGIQYWPMFLRGTGELVGCCGLTPFKPEERLPELGFHLRKAHWGRGYAEEAARAVIDFGFKVLGFPTLFTGHHPDNRGSQRIIEKLGFRYDQDLVYPPTGLLHPTYLLSREQSR
jgi:[ribosomal protein S5]-alanine N-acetyltransferase